ncbi:diacylglycerol O-acyltransferase 1 [Entomophthora muscae]|uniref:Diacylglycerol O-acyltransferase 1 n=1 Tax=Entomophthora muscae TaxID=34485 RepID=A0ACC2RLZ1_9FUNG|nr:diacylglycerol O-acyltransferase 1 [Entomophthora muscae]
MTTAIDTQTNTMNRQIGKEKAGQRKRKGTAKKNVPTPACDEEPLKFSSDSEDSDVSKCSSSATVIDHACKEDFQKEGYTNPLNMIKFAPLNVPMHRRRETLAHVINASLLVGSQILFLLAFLFPFMWPILIAYLVYMCFDQTPETGGRKWEWMRRLTLWKWYADYFPARLIAEAPLDPERNYIFGYHPHGIISMGVFSNFITEATGVSGIFPGLSIKVLTLIQNFNFPIYREYLLSMGLASVSRNSIAHILGSGPGKSCLIVVGGAEESLEAKPNSAKLVLAHRYGFVRMAIICGADLVPVFGFGENQLYDQIENSAGSWTRAIQTRIKHTFGSTLPLFYGRGIFTYNFGLLPHRQPLTVITGAPIRIEQNSNPSQEMVQAVHKQYLEALTDLYNRNKKAYWTGSEAPKLTFI